MAIIKDVQMRNIFRRIPILGLKYWIVLEFWNTEYSIVLSRLSPMNSFSSYVCYVKKVVDGPYYSLESARAALKKWNSDDSIN